MRMLFKEWVPRLMGKYVEESTKRREHTTPLDAQVLAAEYSVSEAIMGEFLNRFSPNRVSENYYKSHSDTMLFIHIPKTAGISVGKSLQEAFDIFYGVQWNDVPRSFRQATRSATYIQSTEGKRQAIMGHFGWPEMQVWKNHELSLKCGTIFRNPLTRLVSNYKYNCSVAHPENEKFKRNFPTLLSYADQVPLDAQLTQAIGFFESFETALKKLITYYTFLGITEHLSESLRHLGLSHGLPSLPEYRENVGGSSANVETTPELRAVVEDRSRNDAKIHQLLTRIYSA